MVGDDGAIVTDFNPSLHKTRPDDGGFQVSLQEFLKEPSMVGSAFPATHWLVDSTLRPLDWTRVRLAVEFGPGTGKFTKAILERLVPQARLIAFETGAGFVRYLGETIDDPRLQVIEAPALAVGQIAGHQGAVDYIVSGIPFSTLPAGEGEEIIAASCEILNDRGRFVAYQMRRNIAALLERRFRDVRMGFEWRNIPPCHLYWASGKR